MVCLLYSCVQNVSTKVCHKYKSGKRRQQQHQAYFKTLTPMSNVCVMCSREHQHNFLAININKSGARSSIEYCKN